MNKRALPLTTGIRQSDKMVGAGKRVPCPEPDLVSDLLSTANAAVDAAGAPILNLFRQASLDTDNKSQSGFDPVTAADRAGEAAMRQVLTRLRPEDSIIGEEFGQTKGTSGVTWVLDPIDGTRGFICGTPVWGVLIAAGDPSGPMLGVIDQPYIGERFVGSDQGAWLDGPAGRQRLATRQPRPLHEAIVMTTSPAIGTPAEVKGFAAVAAKTRLTRYGLDCYAYALLALGLIDLVIEAQLQPYDIWAPIALVRSAGGVLTNWEGGDAHAGGQALAAANPEIHAEALEVLSAFV